MRREQVFQHARIVATVFVMLVQVEARPRTMAAEAGGAMPRIASVRVGFLNHYKLGSWTPVVVDIENPGATAGLRIEVTTSDNDGVSTTASEPVSVGDSSGKRPPTIVYTQIGRVGSPVLIRLFAGATQADELTLNPRATSHSKHTLVPLTATSELIISLSAASFGVSDTLPNRAATTGQIGRTVIELDNIEQLPNQWFGYNAVDALVISVGDGRLPQALAANRGKYAALLRWVELGGRLIIFCGVDHAEAMFGNGAPLAALLPGKLADVVRLPETTSLERFAESSPTISGRSLRVPRLVDVDGTIEVYEGRQPSDLPIVVRAPRALGEITFVGVALDQPPLTEWSGRAAFLRAVMKPYLAGSSDLDASQRMVARSYNNLSGALRQRLGRSFAAVQPIGFPLVTGLVIVYLALLGPVDYFIAHRLLRRPLAAWITFPLVVVTFSALALALGNWSQGPNVTRVNRLTLVDVDTTTAQERGSLWSVLFSPEASRFDLAAGLSERDSKPQATSTKNEMQMLFSWWGLPGTGIGGMQSGGSDLGVILDGYRHGPTRSSLIGVPVLTSATKSFFARWAKPSTARIDSQLSDADGLVVGTLSNGTGRQLLNARLLYGTWAYRLGDLDAGERVDVNEDLSPRKAKTIVTRETLGDRGAAAGQLEGRVFSAEEAAPLDILNLMMFYEVAGGIGFAHLPNRCANDCDMSRLLALGRAILIAEVSEPAAELVEASTKAAIGRDVGETSATVYRFVLPVRRNAVDPK